MLPTRRRTKRNPMTTQQEINDLISTLRKISAGAKKESQTAFKKAAVPLISEIQARAPVSEKPHSRYSTPKAAGKIRAPKGQGRIIATYYPGNLRRSFRTLTFRRSSAVFVGPKLAKQNNQGEFMGARADGYYAHMVEFGTMHNPAQPFVRPAVDSASGAVLNIASEHLVKYIESYNKQP